MSVLIYNGAVWVKLDIHWKLLMHNVSLKTFSVEALRVGLCKNFGKKSVSYLKAVQH